MTASPGGLTILRTTDNRFATKRFVWNATLLEWRKISFNAGALDGTASPSGVDRGAGCSWRGGVSF